MCSAPRQDGARRDLFHAAGIPCVCPECRRAERNQWAIMAAEIFGQLIDKRLLKALECVLWRDHVLHMSRAYERANSTPAV